ncbi:MAG: protein kinase [Acidobacteriia bacterium]|nr:protein kinase [Terriglobia bacterium]
MPDYPERIGSYRITGKLGEGGMGVVYSAYDTRLNRPVALKVIRGSADEENLRKRFVREGQSAARVNHPNICSLYDAGEEQGHPFLVMELLEGESLAARLARGPLALAEAVQVSLGILAALSALHRAQILHRDLKPSNIFLSTHGVKLLDFGLAKPLAQQDDPDGKTQSEITQQGMIAATPRYASPEQVTGQALDARSDLFSCAAVLFEMLTGKCAFPGDSPLQIFHAILYESPPALGGSAAVSAIDRILNRAMDKRPENRYLAADDMAAELRAVLRLDDAGLPIETRTVKRLIVLPFRALRPDPETDFLAFSLPDAIAASLAGLSSLVVRSSLAAARFAGPAPDLKEIAREADVDVVLTGTLLRAGAQLRLSTQLAEAPGGTLIWSKTSQVELRDIFQLQDSLVNAVVESLALPLTAGEIRRLSHDAPPDASAYDLYLRANELGRDWRNIGAAIELYEKCVAKDPGYAPAWARLGRSRWLADKYADASAEKLAEADSAIRRALELSPDLPLAHNIYAQVQVEEGRALEATKGLLERSKTARNDPELFAGLTHSCRYCGLLEASLAAHQQARRLDPKIPTTVVHTYFLLGDYQSALEASQDDFGYATAVSLAMLGRTSEAIALLKEREQPAPRRLARLFMTALRTMLEGDRRACLEASDELMRGTFRDPEGWYHGARQLAYLGEIERALLALSRAVQWNFSCFTAMASDPWLDSLRGDARFKDLLQLAKTRHEEARRAFIEIGGTEVLGCSV